MSRANKQARAGVYGGRVGQACLVRGEESLLSKRKLKGDMLWLAENGSLV